MATDFVKKMANFRRSGLQKLNGITPFICIFNSATNATISYKILVNIGPVVSAENSQWNCVACSRRGLVYFVEYPGMYCTIALPV